jgi:uncharacterized protein (TIGR02722 family)
MKKRGPFFLAGLIILALVGTTACSSNPKVTRVDAGTQTDLSGYWNDGDVRIVCESLINECISSPRVAQAIAAKKGGLPVVLIGSFKNDSSEHIDTSIISKTMEVTIFNSGLLDFVAGGDTREELRAEREDQNNFNSSEDTAALLGNETGADFLLTGSVKTIVDQAGNQTVRTYYVSAELSNISTNSRMWMGQNSEIKKVITRSRIKL